MRLALLLAPLLALEPAAGELVAPAQADPSGRAAGAKRFAAEFIRHAENLDCLPDRVRKQEVTAGDAVGNVGAQYSFEFACSEERYYKVQVHETAAGTYALLGGAYTACTPAPESRPIGRRRLAAEKEKVAAPEEDACAVVYSTRTDVADMAAPLGAGKCSRSRCSPMCCLPSDAVEEMPAPGVCCCCPGDDRRQGGWTPLDAAADEGVMGVAAFAAGELNAGALAGALNAQRRAADGGADRYQMDLVFDADGDAVSDAVYRVTVDDRGGQYTMVDTKKLGGAGALEAAADPAGGTALDGFSAAFAGALDDNGR